MDLLYIFGLAISYWILFHLGMMTEHFLNKRRKRRESDMLKSSDYFIKLSVKVTLVRFAGEEIERLVANKNSEKINEFLENLGRILLS